MPQSSNQMGTGQGSLPSLFAIDGRQANDSADSSRRTPEPLETWEFTVIIPRGDMEALARGVVTPDVLAMADECLAVPTRTVAENVAMMRQKRTRKAQGDTR